MRNRFGNRDGLLGARHRLVGIAQMPEHAPQEEITGRSAVEPKTESQRAVPFRLVKRNSFLQVHSCSAKLGKPEQSITHHVVGVGERLRFLQAFRDNQQLLGNLSSHPNFATRRISQAQPEQCPDKRPLICAGHPAGELDPTCRCVLALRRSKASRKQRRQRGHLEGQFFLVALQSLRQGVE